MVGKIPFVHAINAVVRGALRLFGIDITAVQDDQVSETELRGAIDLHDGEEKIVRHERAMLPSVLDLDDVQGSTFTITNPGVFGGLFGIPILNQPNVVILSIGKIQTKPIV